METDAGTQFLSFVVLASIVGLVVVIARSFRKGKVSRPATTSEPSENSSRGALWATSDGGGDELKRGRQRKPGRQWVCTRCGEEFTLAGDPAEVPVPWWYGDAVQEVLKKTDAPWACPNCGTYAYTVPR